MIGSGKRDGGMYMTNTNKKHACQLQGKKVITSGSVPDAITDLFAEALVQFIQAIEQEEKDKSKSA